MRIAKNVVGVSLLLGFLWGAPGASASLIFGGDSGDLSAQMIIDYTADGHLSVVLANVSNADVLAPADVLTGVFFTLAPASSLDAQSANVTGDSVIWFEPTPSGGDVGTEWAYKDGLSGIVDGTNAGIASAGYDVFGEDDRFDTSGNLQGPATPDGLQYGITSLGDDVATGNTPVTGTNALIQNAVRFEFLLDGDFTDYTIDNVWFQYGTGLDEPSFEYTYVHGRKTPPPPPVPEPASIVLLGMGVAGVLVRKRLLAA